MNGTDRAAIMALSGAIVAGLSDSWTDMLVFGLTFLISFAILVAIFRGD